MGDDTGAPAHTCLPHHHRPSSSSEFPHLSLSLDLSILFAHQSASLQFKSLPSAFSLSFLSLFLCFSQRKGRKEHSRKYAKPLNWLLLSLTFIELRFLTFRKPHKTEICEARLCLLFSSVMSSFCSPLFNLNPATCQLCIALQHRGPA